MPDDPFFDVLGGADLFSERDTAGFQTSVTDLSGLFSQEDYVGDHPADSGSNFFGIRESTSFVSTAGSAASTAVSGAGRALKSFAEMFGPKPATQSSGGGIGGGILIIGAAVALLLIVVVATSGGKRK